MTADPPAHFDADLLDVLRTVEEVEIETWRPADGARRTIIWVVVADGMPYIRSYRGPDARWYREIREEPKAILHFGGRGVPVRAVREEDPDRISTVSAGLSAKYASDPATPAMLRPEVLGTTLRLEPA